MRSPAPRPRRARDRRRRRAARRREPRPRAAGLRALAQTKARPAGADARRRRRPGHVDAGASASGSRRASTLPGGSAARERRSAAAHRRPRGRHSPSEPKELNRERQVVEDRILREAVAQVESWPEARRRPRGYVVAGEDWHEGVIGIVASRLVERYGGPSSDRRRRPLLEGIRPLDSAFDLHAALAACAGHLERFGGHRAAAGLSIDPRTSTRSPRRSPPRRRSARRRGTAAASPVDASCAAPLTLDSCRSSTARAVRARQPGGHAAGRRLRARRARRRSARASTCASASATRGRAPAAAIAFGLGPQLDRFRRVARYDVAFRLRGEPLQLSAPPVARRPPDLRRSRRLRGPRRAWLAEGVAAPSGAQRDPDALSVFS